MAVATAALALPALVVGTSNVVQAAGGTRLADFRVESSQGGAQITTYKWLVNLDNTGDPAFTAQSIKDCLPDRAGVDPRLTAVPPASAVDGDLADCPWPSTRAVPGDSPVIASGTDADVGRLADLATFDAGNGSGNGRYLISVTARDYKIDGIHFEVAGGKLVTVNDDLVGPTVPFTVKMNPMPKLTATVRVHVYNDNASTNGQWDGQTETLLTCAAPPDGESLPAGCNGVINPNWVADPETDMSGFTVSIKDVLADVTTDVFGNPLCTEYAKDGNGKVILDQFGSPTPVSFGSTLGGTESSCISDHYGDVVIPNLGPNRYAASIIPPDARTHEGDQWVQTTTLEGGHDWDTWNQEGGSGYDTELVVGGERVTPVAHGFVKLTHSDYEYAEMINDPKIGPVNAKAMYYDASGGFTGGTPGTGVLTGAIHVGRAYIGSGAGAPLAGMNLANAKDDGVIEDGLISINCIATCSAPADSAVWVGRSDPDTGAFTVTGLQTGDYSVAFWDEAQSHILAVLQYHVDGTRTAVPARTYPAITAANRVSATNFTLTFASNPQVNVGDVLTLAGNSNTSSRWTGNWTVAETAVNSNPNVIRITKANSLPNANSNPSGLYIVAPTVLVDPAPTDAGNVLLPGWFTDLTGTIFIDTNEDGRQDTGEVGVPDFGVTVRTRGNSLQDQGAAASTTGEDGGYDLSQAYPLGQFLIFEAYNPRYQTTGYNYSTDNDLLPNGERNVHVVDDTGQVDFNFLPIIGLSGEINVGVKPYEPFENGGIAGTVSYDVTRNEFDPAFSAPEDYQPSIPGLPVQLWKTAKAAADGAVVHYLGAQTPAFVLRKADGVTPIPGSVGTTWTSGAVVQIGTTSSGDECVRPDTSRGTDAVVTTGQTCFPWDHYTTEHWTRPTGCVALDVSGNPLQGELVLPELTAPFDESHSDPANPDCVEAPMNGMQIGGDGSVNGNYALSNLIKPSAFVGSSLSDAYASNHDDGAKWAVLPPDDYVVEVVNPVDTLPAKAKDADEGGFYAPGSTPKHLYRFTDETSINVFSGDSYVPQEGTVGGGSDGGGDPLSPFDSSVERQDLNTIGAGTVALCGGTMATVHNSTDADNYETDFTGGGGSPFDGQERPVCDAKLVKVVNGRSVAPTFFMYTDVPIPSKFYGLINDDLNVQTDRRSTLLGEVAPVSNGPIGIYDEMGNWKYTAHSDVNGNYEVLLPSMGTYNCPLPAGPCANVYRLVGNDPGTLFHRNTDYNPQFRTIATNFQAWTGVIHPVDQAPTHIGITIEGPAAQFGALSLCKVNDFSNPDVPVTPEIFSINRPYFDPGNDNGSTVFVLKGQGFGSQAGQSQVQLDGFATGVTTIYVSDTELNFRLATSVGQAAHQLSVKRLDSGVSTVNGLTFHRLSPSGGGSSTYLRRSDVYEVRSHSDYSNPATAIANDDPGNRVFTPMHDAWDPATDTAAGFAGQDVNGQGVTGGRAIQRAVEQAYVDGASGNAAKLVVIYPNEASNYEKFNANAAYFENVVLHGKVMLQGVGTGGVYSSTDFVHGAAIDASTFWAANGGGTNPQIADGNYSDEWRLFANGIARADTEVAELPEGQAILAVAEDVNQWAPLTVDRGTSSALRPRTPQYVDVVGGTADTKKNGVDGLLITGGNQQGNPGGVNTAPGAVGADVALGGQPGPAQGGAITLDRYVRDFRITNNLIQSNGGTYGAIRIGTPDLPNQDNHNERPVIMSNRIIANGGTNLAGALGLFFGADKYVVRGNDFCGNFSAEYGGAISHYGSSPGGTIDHNRIYYNQSYDEGGAVFIAGNLPANPQGLSLGAGGTYVESVDTTNRRAITNSSLLGVTLDSNLIVSNQSNDDGGGVRFLMAGKAPFRLSNNVIANNLATHEGGGIALDDAPYVTIVNNTIVKNVTTGTAATNAAVTSVGAPETGAIVPAGSDVTATAIKSPDTGPAVRPQNPAGLATGPNSSQLQGDLPSGSPSWSKPVLINNLFADNLSGWAELPTAQNFNQNAIKGIGVSNGSTKEERWDVGCATYNCVFDGPDIHDNTTNSSNPSHRLLGSSVYYGDNLFGVGNAAQNEGPSGDGTDIIGFVKAVDFLVDSLGWRVNTNVSFPVIVAQMVPVTLLADYHLTESSQHALNLGAAPTRADCATSVVPCDDIDGEGRYPGTTDRGADEIATRSADISITMTVAPTSVTAGGVVAYTIRVTNNGPDSATGITLSDAVPVGLSLGAWSCSGTCSVTYPTGTSALIGSLGNGQTAQFTVNATVAANAAGTITNTATVGGGSPADGNAGNNSATAAVTVVPPAPAPAVLDNFNRNNTNNTLGTSTPAPGVTWAQPNGLRINSQTANSNTSDNVTASYPTVYGTTQAAGFTFANNSTSNIGLILKASSQPSPTTYLLVGVNSSTVTVTGVQSGTDPTTAFPASFANGDRIVARANADGTVEVWKVSGSTTTYLGKSAANSNFTGNGRIGLWATSTNPRIDNFAGGTVAP